jgi:hypothetical protein
MRESNHSQDVLLERARLKRVHAQKCRELAEEVPLPEARETLRKYAEELEERALGLEAMARESAG